MKPSEHRAGLDVVAFSPHPDDVELFCGGTMLLAAAAGRSTAIVDLTEGELSTSGDPATRAAERAEATELLGLTTRVSLDLGDGRLGSDDAQRAAVVRVLRELAPRVVLAPHGGDRHPDHAAAGRLVRDACFLAGVARYGAGCPHRPQRVYWYMLHHLFEPSVVVDVGPVWERRLRLLDVYASQLSAAAATAATPLTDGRFTRMLLARATSYGAMVGVDHGEPFRLDGPLLVRSLPDLEAPPADAPRYQAYV